MRKELEFYNPNKPTTLRDLIEKHPEVLDMQIAVQDRDFYTLIGTESPEGTMGSIYIDEGEVNGEKVPVVLFCYRTD